MNLNIGDVIWDRNQSSQEIVSPGLGLQTIPFRPQKRVHTLKRKGVHLVIGNGDNVLGCNSVIKD